MLGLGLIIVGVIVVQGFSQTLHHCLDLRGPVPDIPPEFRQLLNPSRRSVGVSVS
jgi:hypothetical protein